MIHFYYFWRLEATQVERDLLLFLGGKYTYLPTERVFQFSQNYSYEEMLFRIKGHWKKRKEEKNGLKPKLGKMMVLVLGNSLEFNGSIIHSYH